MKDEIPNYPNVIECGVVNLQDSHDKGSHWVAYYKTGMKKVYFDSYGNVKPPKELVIYLGGRNLFYNMDRIQEYDDPPICGHLCLIVLSMLVDNVPFNKILFILKKNKMRMVEKLLNDL